MTLFERIRGASLAVSASLVFAVGVASFSPPASAARFHGYARGYHGGFRGGWGPGAVIGGLAAGILGAAAANSYWYGGGPYYYGPYYGGYYGGGCYPARVRTWTPWGWRWRIVERCY